MQAKTRLYVDKYQLFSEKKWRFVDKKWLKIPTRNLPPTHPKKYYEKHPRGSARGARKAPLAMEGKGSPPPTHKNKTMKNTRGRGAGRGQAAPTPQQAHRGAALVLLPKDRFRSP